MRIVGLGHGLFAVAAASLAILSLAYGDFGPSGQSLPAWIPLREILDHGSALFVLAASAGLCFSRTALPSALTIGTYQAVWAMIGIPPILSKPLSIGAWYGFCEALTSLVGAGILYAMLRWQSQGSEMPIAVERAVRVAQVLFGLTCVFYGWSHFAYADYTASMVPTWLPSPLGLAYFTGLGHLAAGIGIVCRYSPPSSDHPRGDHDELVWPSRLGAELFGAAPARMGDAASKSMVGARRELGVGCFGVHCRNFFEKPANPDTL